AAAVLDILRGAPAPADRLAPALSLGAPRLAFKTGTSYGFRDAVAAGVGDGFTVVVWTGRPDGGAREGLTGRAAALPLLFQAFDALEAGRAPLSPVTVASAPRAAPAALARLADPAPGPHLVFPPDGAQVMVDGFGPGGSGLALAGVGEGLRWYVDGRPLAPGPAGGAPVWRPAGAGFYRVSAVDAAGLRAVSRVRVIGG
ncbi:MAG: penicillin-binding protein 1C, partial [Caulobacteraceae bacterium]|nr:penicillin-binding protein 1C [Caulobacter sp.]